MNKLELRIVKKTVKEKEIKSVTEFYTRPEAGVYYNIKHKAKKVWNINFTTEQKAQSFIDNVLSVNSVIWIGDDCYKNLKLK